MRVLFSCWPFAGHVFPPLSIAAALRDRGHTVAFYTGTEFRQRIEDEGFEVFPFRRVESAWTTVQERERAVGGRRQSLRVQYQAYREWLVETIPGQVSDLEEICASWHPDVLAADASMWGPILVLNETLPIPVVLASPLTSALVPGPDAPVRGRAPAPGRRGELTAALTGRVTELVARPIRRRLDELRAGYGLGPMGCSVNAYYGRLPLYLVLCIPELDHNRWDLPDTVRYVGACQRHPAESPETAAWLETIGTEQPWVHITEGTSHFQDPFVIRAAVAGLADRPLEAVISTGRDRAPAELGLGPTARNIHLTRWLSHDTLLPRCAAVVTTGGPATVMAALSAGVPLVIVPTTWEKPDTARRVAGAGAAVVVPPRRCTPARLRAAVEEVLGDPGYRRAAQACAARLAAAPGPAGAARLIEQLAPREAAPVELAVTR
jgi:MGT family glycosyltransferase